MGVCAPNFPLLMPIKVGLVGFVLFTNDAAVAESTFQNILEPHIFTIFDYALRRHTQEHRVTVRG